MITLPVTAQMYHSLVQQHIPNNDNTVCVQPMQVQNFISNNSLCGSNLNTTYIMTANNRNVINLPMQTSMKTVITNPTMVQSIYAPKSRTIVRKTYIKKKALNLAVKPLASSSPPEDQKNVNNNSTNVLNRNKKNLHPQKVEKLQTSQSKESTSEEKVNRSSKIDDSDEAKVKTETSTVENE